MRYHIGTLAFAALFVLAAAGSPSSAQEKSNDAAMQEMMKKYEAAMTPGPQHKALAAMEGTWDAETKMWMGGPSTPPSVTKGTATMKMIFGGRFLQQEATGEMMGKPFHGIGYTGYDNMNKKFISFWIDEMGTGFSTADGVMNQAGDAITFYGKMDEPGTGEHGKNVKFVSRIVGKDKQVFEMYDLSRDDPNSKVMEIVYTRKK